MSERKTIDPNEWKYPQADKMIVQKREGETTKDRLNRLIEAARYINNLEGYRGAETLHRHLDEIETILSNLNIDETNITKHELKELRWDAFRREMAGIISGMDRSSIDVNEKFKFPSKLDQVKKLKEVIIKLEECLAQN